ncbi:MAG: hypothetical protein J1F03_00475 [Oscillospiraceae bacterium]|nr:hypothetical protein [Oscillospiraceae bacterium]
MIEILQNRENLDKIEFNARDGAEDLGTIAGELKDEVFVIDELSCGDFMADGLVRAVLNLMNLHGIDKARFEVSEKHALLKQLGFFSDKPEIESISEFFDKKCCK